MKSWVGIFVLILVFGVSDLGFCRDINMKRTLGGLKATQNTPEIETIARFAVQEHNKKENSLLQFGRVVKAKEQMVAGKMYHLTVEAVDSGKKKIYEAKVWVKPWMNFKQLQEFKYIATDIPIFTSTDLTMIRGH